MYSIIFTAAIFIAIILNDIIYKRGNNVALHGSFGGLAVGLVGILWYLGYEMVAWTLILLPILALTFSYILATKSPSKAVSESKTVVGAPASVLGHSGVAATAATSTTCNQYNPAGPYMAIAPPATSTVSLPASPPAAPTPATTATATSATVPSFSITPISAGC